MDESRILPKLSLTTNRYFVIISLISISLIGAYFRFVGVNWDENRHQHPDERFMTMVAEQIRPVEHLSDYFDPEASSLNPFDFGSFTYGMLPLFLTRYIAEWFAKTSYDQIVLVGRVLSGLFDLAAIGVLYLIGARLYNRGIGLLAAALYSAAVVPIQLSHFFAVDSFTTVFMLAAIYVAVRASDQPRWWMSVLFGALTGMAMATKVSIAPLGGLILVPGIINIVAAWPDRAIRVKRVVQAVAGLVIAGFFTVLFFRVFHPYAFSGPGFFDLSLNPRWLAIMREVTDQVAGKADYPPNHHWAGRSWWYGWTNMVQWGMGLPLGLAATIGWFWAVRRIWKGEWTAHVIPVLWVGAYFLWQSSQFWRYTRYYLPIYPLAILLAAWAITEGYKTFQTTPPTWLGILSTEGKRPLRQYLMGALIFLIVGGTYFYAFAFIQIYRRPHTRVAASHWMLEQIPGPFKAHVETLEGLQTIPLGKSTDLVLEQGDGWTGSFTPDEAGMLAGISTPLLGLTQEGGSSARLTVTVNENNSNKSPRVSREVVLPLQWSGENSPMRSYMIDLPGMAVEAGMGYDLTIELESESPIKLSGASIAIETRWDDSLPLPVRNIFAYPGLFRLLDLELHEADTEEKRRDMLETLDKADYIVIASNRAYDAMPRMPHRFPLTLAYYQALFGCDAQLIIDCAYPAQAPMEGNLGFNLVATFESYPGLGPLVIPDQGAQESFTVYDHPKVLVFQKAPDFSLDHVRSVLEGVDLTQIVSQSAKQFTEVPGALRLSHDRRELQEDGGTWTDIFSTSSALNRSPLIGVFSWYVLIFLFGWIAFPFAFFAFKGLSDRGYGFSRLVGLLVVGWIAWFGSSYQLFPFSRLVLWIGFGVLWMLAAGIAWNNFDLYLSHVRKKWRQILTMEGVFLALFLFALVIRWYNPDLWHPWRGGEKPGDLALFHAVLKTVHFPPYDPWLAGNYVHYFYFGYVLAAVPTKLLGILPEIAYNLLIPTWFGLTGLGIFSIAYNLAGARSETGKNANEGRRRRSLPYLAGGAALMMGLLLGNFAEIRILWEQLPGFSPERASDPNFLEQARDAAIGLGQILTGKEELFRGDYGVWYFDASRAIFSGESIAPITEFPYFSFLYADLHPHLLGMPVVLCGLAWLLSFLYSPPLISKYSLRKEWVLIVPAWLIGGLVVGASYPTNTWDFPTVMLLGVIAIGFATWRYPYVNLKRTILDMSLHIGLLYFLAVGFFGPFRQWFSTGDITLEMWQGPRTPLIDYLTVHGLFLFVIVTYLLIETGGWVRLRIEKVIHTPLGELVPGFRRAVPFMSGIFLVVILGGGWLWENDFQTAGMVILLGIWAGVLLLKNGLPLNRKIFLILIGAGSGLSFIAEMVALHGDIGRMNVVFKSYLLVWLFFSITAGAILSTIWESIRSWKTGWVWIGALGVLMIASSAYPLIGTLARIEDRWPGVQSPPLTLNGMSFMNGDNDEKRDGLQSAVYMEQQTPLRLADDYRAFLWIRSNIEGTPTIVEGHTGEYRWGSRYSVYTGLPTVVGWSWHLRQHNVVLPGSVVEKRIADVNNFYNTTSQSEALEFLERYQVILIVVGDLERAIYSEAGLAKFAQMAARGDLEIVYPESGLIAPVNIFAVP